MYLYQRSIFYIHTHKYNCMQSNASTVKMHEREGATHRIFGVWRRNCQSKIQHRTTTKNDAVTKWTVVIEHLLFCIDVSIRWFFVFNFQSFSFWNRLSSIFPFCTLQFSHYFDAVMNGTTFRMNTLSLCLYFYGL